MFKTNRKIKNSIELISIHIPKTAGTSFRNILKQAYGEEHVVRFDIQGDPPKVLIENELFTRSKLPGNIKVIHGHFKFPDLTEFLQIKEETPVITWLRDPVERVVSNYYYLAKRLKEELNEEEKGLNILAKMQKSLMEYAQTEMNRNRMSKFMQGIDPGKLTFIGIMEYYRADLEIFRKLFNLPEFEIFEHNITGIKKEVSEAEMEEIRKLNEADVRLYKKALKLREHQLSKYNTV